jgi:small GTP-binding protein
MSGRLHKVVILGAASVGKTCFLHQCAKGVFLGETVPTITPQSHEITLISSTNRTVWISLWDTAGQEAFRSLTTVYVRDADCILFAFSLTDSSSFDKLNEWLKFAGDGCELKCSFVIGMKRDLAEKRQIPRERGESWASEPGPATKYVEVSSLSGDGIQAFLGMLADAIDEQDGNRPKTNAARVVSVRETPGPKTNTGRKWSFCELG